MVFARFAAGYSSLWVSFAEITVIRPGRVRRELGGRMETITVGLLTAGEYSVDLLTPTFSSPRLHQDKGEQSSHAYDVIKGFPLDIVNKAYRSECSWD
jgi:hypothetical protein